MPSICSQGSSSKRSRAPQVNAPCAPPPCNAKSIRTRSRLKLSPLLVATGVVLSDGKQNGASPPVPPPQLGQVRVHCLAPPPQRCVRLSTAQLNSKRNRCPNICDPDQVLAWI